MHRLQNLGRNPRKTNGLILSIVTFPYIGRFAPSPTGPLHLGSLYTALASFLDARRQNGLWLLRIDDLDTPRNVKGASDAILRCLEAFRLHWDRDCDFQSRHLEQYQDYLDQLRAQGRLFACRCTRKQLTTAAIYPGTCRDQAYPTDEMASLRVLSDNRQIDFHDALQGDFSQNLAGQHGDFILRRRDGIIAYQFAVVVDDQRQGINHVVRGNDLLDSTPKQIYLQQLLGLPRPAYLHLPVIVGSDGCKLSKQTFAAPVDSQRPTQTLFQLLQLLQQQPPPPLRQAGIDELLQWAINHWQPQALRKMSRIEC